MDILFWFDFFASFFVSVLAIAPGDEDAIKCKVVALIKSEATDKALKTIKAASSLSIDLSFYKVCYPSRFAIFFF